MTEKKSKVIDVKRISERKRMSDDEFTVNEINDDPHVRGILETANVVYEEPKTAEKVKVKFNNFVELVANHDYKDTIDRNKNEDIILSSNLLADLANSHEANEGKKVPAVFIIGVVLGIAITYILMVY